METEGTNQDSVFNEAVVSPLNVIGCVSAAAGGHVAALCREDHRGHPVRGGVRQTHRRLHGPLPERPDRAAESW